MAFVVPVAAQAQAKSWHHRDVTATAGAPGVALASDLTGFAVGGIDPRVYFVTSFDGHVNELAYYQHAWRHRDLTADSGAPTAYAEPMAGFREGISNSRLYYQNTANGHVQELAYSSGWRHSDITAAAGNPPTDNPGPLAAFQVAGRDPRVYYVNNNGHVNELAYYQGGWHHRDLTADTGAPPVNGKEWTAFPVAGIDPRIYYFDSAMHVRELAYYQGGWHPRDITAATGAPAATEAIAGFAVGPGGADPRVYYGDTADHVSELAYYQGGWHHRDITADTGAPAGASGLAGFAIGDTDSRVYSASQGHIHEFSYYQHDWHYRDLTADTGAPPYYRHVGVRVAAFPVDGADPRVYYVGDDQHAHELAYYQDGGGGGQEPTTRTVTLERQQVWAGFIPYLGRFPPFGVVPSGRLLQIRVPQVGPVDLSVYFVKAGHSTKECSNASAVVPVNEGQSTTPEQISAIFGQSQPSFSTTNPLAFVACIATNAGEAPNWRDIEITVQFE
jgi:hypothetical protein